MVSRCMHMIWIRSQIMRSLYAVQEKTKNLLLWTVRSAQLDENVLMICDGEKAVGIAGIMGGENSMITDDVKTMLFEAACFDGTEHPSVLQRESDFVQMLPENLKKVWIRTMHRQPSTVPAS